MTLKLLIIRLGGETKENGKTEFSITSMVVMYYSGNNGGNDDNNSCGSRKGATRTYGRVY